MKSYIVNCLVVNFQMIVNTINSPNFPNGDELSGFYEEQGFQIGDEVTLKEWVPSTGIYTGREGTFTVKECVRGPMFAPPGWLQMSFNVNALRLGDLSGDDKLIVDIINHPTHYTKSKIQSIDVIKAATSNLIGIEAHCTACAIKYLYRWKDKNGIEDLKKAVWYINRLIVEGDNPDETKK